MKSNAIPCLLLLLAAVAHPAHGQTRIPANEVVGGVTFTFNPTSQTTRPLGVLMFSGTITNNTNTAYVIYKQTAEVTNGLAYYNEISSPLALARSFQTFPNNFARRYDEVNPVVISANGGTVTADFFRVQAAPRQNFPRAGGRFTFSGDYFLEILSQPDFNRMVASAQPGGGPIFIAPSFFTDPAGRGAQWSVNVNVPAAPPAGAPEPSSGVCLLVFLSMLVGAIVRARVQNRRAAPANVPIS